MLEDIIKVPVLGVIPYIDIKIEDEDSVTTRFKNTMKKNDINIEIIRTPHMSNFTDFNIFETQEDVSVRYVDYGESLSNPDIVILPGSKSTIEDLKYIRKNGLEDQIKELHNVSVRYVDYGESLSNPDIVILPGSKSTIEDLKYIRKNGLEDQIKELHRKGKLVFGICGGYQMLGKKLKDSYYVDGDIDEYDGIGLLDYVDGDIDEYDGIGLLDIETTFEKEKTTTQVEANICENLNGYMKNLGL